MMIGDEYRIRTVDEYISEIMNHVNGQLGTPFQWTYPSGGKGKRIQLKCKLISVAQKVIKRTLPGLYNYLV